MKFITTTAVLLVLCAALAPQAHAQADMGFKGAGVEIGIVSPEDLDATFGFGLFADLGTVAPQFALESYFDFWTRSENQFGVEFSARDIALGMKGKYLFQVSNPRVRPFVGAGLGLHFVHVETSELDLGFGVIIPGVSDNTTKLGVDIGGGLNATINERADFIGEMWYGFVTDVNQLSVKAGILYRFDS